MALYDDILSANRRYAAGFDRTALAMPPALRLAVLACMDARLTVEEALGLRTGDAHIIRNAGGLATDDALRSLIISQHLLGTREILVINHTDCGMLTFRGDDLRDRLKASTGHDPDDLRFHTFSDLATNVSRQVEAIRACPFLLPETRVHGMIFDVKTGALNEATETVSVGAA